MDNWTNIAAIIFIVVLLFFLYNFLKSNPKSLTWPNINKSMFTLGILALVLIAFIGVIVWLLGQT